MKVEHLNSMYRNKWWNSSSELKLENQPSTYWEKRKNEKKFNTLIDNIINHIENFPEDVNARVKWKEIGNKYLDNIILKEDTFKLGILDKEMKAQFFRSTNDFIKACKSFDKSLNYEDIGQAMRNVWIVNIFQKVVGEEIKFTDAIFGYSMLYPYTDNYLDDIGVTKEEKKEFNNRFTRRLKGNSIKAVNPHEDKVYNLVAYIESVFQRDKYPMLYDSLLLIHQGQIKSLTQQDEVTIPYERDILEISIEKGGASVLADGYLIRGTLTEEEEDFAYGYGFLLQLCDDLQDVKSDLENNHMTVMSQLATKYPLDVMTNKLINLTIDVVDNARCFKDKNSSELRKLIKDNCINMILFAIADNEDYFSKAYIEEISKILPFRMSYIKELKKNLNKKFKKLTSIYEEEELEKILLYLIE